MSLCESDGIEVTGTGGCLMQLFVIEFICFSNFDERLNPILEHLKLRPFIDAVFPSKESVSHGKPDPRFFHHALEELNRRERRLQPNFTPYDFGDIIHVGDSIKKDIEGARNVGMKAALMLRGGYSHHGEDPNTESEGCSRLYSLHDLDRVFSIPVNRPEWIQQDSVISLLDARIMPYHVHVQRAGRVWLTAQWVSQGGRRSDSRFGIG